MESGDIYLNTKNRAVEENYCKQNKIKNTSQKITLCQANVSNKHLHNTISFFPKKCMCAI